jgi:hypothetical protein
MADEAIKYMQGLKAAAPDSPWFVYYVPGGSHSPHQPKQEWIDKFHGKFDMGWNAMRDQIFANQKRLGVIPENAKLTEWPDGLQPRYPPGRVVCQHDASPWALDIKRALACPNRLQVGVVQPDRGLLAGQRSCGEDAGQAEANAGPV